jgi:membrane protein implicated in regulation of membrane protease activity
MDEFFNFISNNLVFVWIALAVIFGTIEGLTLGLVTAWFTVGAAASAIVALLNGDWIVQIVVFIVVSFLLLILARPILVKKLKLGKELNNIEQLENARALVTEPIEPFKSGLVKVNGVIWTAVGENREFKADSGTEVKIVRVEGVKLIVTQDQS